MLGCNIKNVELSFLDHPSARFVSCDLKQITAVLWVHLLLYLIESGVRGQRPRSLVREDVVEDVTRGLCVPLWRRRNPANSSSTSLYVPHIFHSYYLKSVSNF